MRAGLAEVLDALRAQRDVDLRGYVTDVLERRLAERLKTTKTTTTMAYLERLETDPLEVDALLTAFHVGTTGFFRDPLTFAAIEETVLPQLASPTPIRAWVPGCSTGEDAWSLASCIEVVLADTSTVIGSDIDDVRLATAARGRYRQQARDQVPEHHRRCFLDVDGALEPIEYLRLRTTFAHHDLVEGRLVPAEALVASFQIIMVRNVLLYFKGDARRRVIERLLKSLAPRGAFIVGSTETVTHPLLQPWPGTRPEARVFQKALP